MTGPQYRQHSSGVPLIRPTVLRQVADFANVFKAFIGTNWIGLPFAFKESGFVLGLVGILVIAVVTDHCCHLVIKCKRAAVQKVLDTVCLSDVTDVESQLTQAALLRDTVEKRMLYGDIGRIAMGKWGVLLVNIALLATQYGFCVGYFIFMGNTIALMFTVPVTPLHNGSASNVTSPPSHSHHPPPFALIVLIPLLPLILFSYIRGVRRLGPISFMANIALFVAFLSVIGYMLSGLKFKWHEIKLAHWATFPVFFGQVTSAYEGIGTLIPIETSMAESKHRFPLYLHFAIGGLSAILACFGMLGYLVYGEDVAQIVTDSFHPGPLILAVRCLLCFAILLTYPLQLFPIIEIVESWLFKSEAKNARTESSLNNDLSTSSDDAMISQVDNKSVTVNECSRLLAPEIPKEKSRLRQWKKNLLRTLLVLSTAGIAIALKHDFAFVSAIVGSVGSSTLGFILPCVFHLVLYKETNTRLIKAKDCLLITFGLLGGVVGLTVTIMQMVKQFSKT
ncbi:proton-coupled amino acid transporter 1-like [Acropora millepora]|uniref:proton-coupled amino acid transporter 1-like n=1 Tax=Acropora millepora TaxID=45264 RepID=UPI001CF4DFA7|nr:proton-coupled amino acid transporter 1-like [Acropora millepora]